MTPRMHLFRSLSASVIGIGLLAGLSHAQEPAGRAGGVAIEFGAESVAGAKSAMERARDYLKEKGLAEGWNADKRLWIGIGSATIGMRAADDGWDVVRYNAFLKATADAKKKAAERLGVAVSTAMSSSSRTGSDLDAGKKEQAASPDVDGAKELGVLDKVAVLVNSQLDEELAKVRDAKESPEAKAAREAAKRQELTQKLLKDAKFQSVAEFVSNEQLCGMQCFRTFEEIPADRQGSIAVIMACNDASMALASALMGNSADAPSGGPGSARTDIKRWAESQDPGKTLLFTFGCQIRQNEKGEVVLVAFGQACPSDDDEDLYDDARLAADDAALEAARNFVGEMISTRGTLSRQEQLKKYKDAGGRISTIRDARQESLRTFNAEAKELMMRGVEDVRRWDARHPLSGVPTFGSIRVFSLSGAFQANRDREAQARVGGAAGGAGVRGTGPAGSPGTDGKSQPPAKRGNGGSSGSGAEPDLP